MVVKIGFMTGFWEKSFAVFLLFNFLMAKMLDDIYFYTSLCRTAPIKGFLLLRRL